MLTQVGILEALAIQLSSFMVATGVCSTTGNSTSSSYSRYSNVLPPAIKRPGLAALLEAVGTIVQNSKFRATQFLAAPAFAAVLPRAESGEASESDRKASMWMSNLLSHPPNFLASPNPLETLIPQMPISNYRGLTVLATNLPSSSATGGLGKVPQMSRPYAQTVEASLNQVYDFTEEDENPLILWLIYLARAESGITRLMAAWILALFYRLGLASRRRETSFAYLLMPILVRMLEKDSKVISTDRNQYSARMLRSSGWLIKEQAPAVLAMLAVESPELQRAAVDAGAIKKLSQLLKESYDPLPAQRSSPVWTPHPVDLESSEYQSKSSRLGGLGISPMAYHVTRMREEVLKGLAAIASLKDEYRKDIIENGIVPFVIESLKPAGPHETQGDRANDPNNLTGNPHAVILAACAAARGLSRSVSTLRTSLMDAGLAAPLFVLLKHPEVDIQIAATAVICNLVLEFSPMREVMTGSCCIAAAF